MLDNTVLITLPVLAFVTVTTVRQIKQFNAPTKYRTMLRWLCIIAGICAVGIPALAAVTAAIIAFVGSGLMISMGRNYQKVASGTSQANGLYGKAIGLFLLGVLPLVITSRLLG